MRNLLLGVMMAMIGCQSSQVLNSDTTEVLKTSQILEVLADYQTYMWDKDSLSWHQPLNLTIDAETKPLFSVIYTISEIKRRNDPAFIDSLSLNFKFKKIILQPDLDQKFINLTMDNKTGNKKILFKTTGRLTIDGVDFQIFSIDNPKISAQLIYVKYYSTYQKDFQIRRFLIRNDGAK